MLNTIAQNPGYSPSSHRHRLPNLHKKLAANALPVQNAPVETKSPERGALRVILVVCLLLCLLSGTAYLIAKHAGDEIARAGHTIDRNQKRILIKSDVITAPANMIRYPSQRRLVVASQLDLYLHWPKLQGYSEALKHVFNDTENNSKIIFVKLSPRFSSFDMSARIEPIYKKFFVGPAADIGAGLHAHALDAEAGFIDEYLIVEKNNPHPYSARCIKKSANVATPYCIRDFHIGKGLSLSYRFHSDLIPQWLALERSIRQKFKAMIN